MKTSSQIQKDLRRRIYRYAKCWVLKPYCTLFEIAGNSPVLLKTFFINNPSVFCQGSIFIRNAKTMENKSTEQLNMDLPPYTTWRNSTGTKKYWIVAIFSAIFLAAIIVTGTLIGLYITQKHTEQLVTVAFSTAEGEKVEQTVSVDKAEALVTIYVNHEGYSGTFLFDYGKKLIAFRKPNSSTCFVLRMQETKTPALGVLLKGMEYFRTHNATVNDLITYNIIQEKEANPTEVGFNVYLLCSDATIYWSKTVDRRQSKLDGIHADFHIAGVHIKVDIDW